MNRSDGKFVLTSGAAPAIGAATMRLMAQAGGSVVASDETCFVTRSIRLVGGVLTGQYKLCRASALPAGRQRNDPHMSHSLNGVIL